MTEILTESFCERCGTRYTFESAAPRKSRMGRMRVVSRGLRNFVMQDESTFSEAMADARSEEERSATAQQLDAFHKTFNFCMSCRQYTCSNCWNVAEGRCLTCSPVPGMELPAPQPMAAIAPEAAEAADGVAAWPEEDLGIDRLLRALGPVPEAGSAPEAEAGAPVRGVAPGQSLEDAIARYEAQIAAEEEAESEAEFEAEAEAESEAEAEAEALTEEVAAEPEPVPVAEPEPVAAFAAEPELEPEPEPVATFVAEPEHEPVAAFAAEPELEPEPEPVATFAAEPEPVAAAPREDVVPQPTWPIDQPVAPSQTPTPAPTPEPAPVANPWLTVAPDDGSAGEPQWPIASGWARNARADVPTTLAGRQLLPRDDAAALWAASAREVLTGVANGPQPLAAAAPATPKPCVSCGLSLSANARFCRRCGTPQA